MTCRKVSHEGWHITIKIDNKTSRQQLDDTKGLARTNEKLSLRLENFEERMSIESTRIQFFKDENHSLKQSLQSCQVEKDKLQKLLDKNFGMIGNCINLLLESLNHNMKTFETKNKRQTSMLDKEMNDLLTSRNKEMKKLKIENQKTKKEVMKLKLEVRVFQTVIGMAKLTSPDSILAS